MKLAQNVVEELWFSDPQAEEEISFNASQSLAAKVTTITGLKTFPVVAHKILQILGRPNYRVFDVKNALEEDPSLASGILKMGNSAFFAGYKGISTIEQAFVRLGSRSVRETVLAVATMQMFPDVGDGTGKLIRDHCAAVAAIAQTLARDFTPKYTDGIFVSGLLHDIGKLMLIDSGEHTYSVQTLNDPYSPDGDALEERTALGFDHGVLAGHVVAAWKLPPPIPTVVAWSHQLSRAYAERDIATMVSLLRLADSLEKLAASEPEDYEAGLERIAQSEAATYLRVDKNALLSRWQTLYMLRGDALAMFSS
ncbi:MAG: HDOD domain-containing protein [Myxococcota bacterium]|jgi:HD-like signal output (HDOD) protein|nr:HDOD domain-containing protein [Myxococcota bacterium]